MYPNTNSNYYGQPPGGNQPPGSSQYGPPSGPPGQPQGMGPGMGAGPPSGYGPPSMGGPPSLSVPMYNAPLGSSSSSSNLPPSSRYDSCQPCTVCCERRLTNSRYHHNYLSPVHHLAPSHHTLLNTFSPLFRKLPLSPHPPFNLHQQ